MPDSNITFTPNLALSKLPANYRVWAQIMNDNLTLLDAAVAGFVIYDNWRGAWSNSTHYAVGDTVVDLVTAVIWTAQVDHTSAQIPTTFSQEQILHPTYWSLANAPATKRGMWMPDTAYNVNDFVLADGVKYAMCLIQHVSGPVFDVDAAAGKWTVLIDFGVGTPISVGSAPPLVPVTNQLWWSSDLGQLFVWYNDGNSTQWVPASPSGTTNNPLSPMAFGAVGDGVTDDSAAFAAMRIAGGTSGVYQLTPGKTFYLGSPFILNRQETILGWGATLKIANSSSVGIALGDSSSIFTGSIYGVRVTKDGVFNVGDIGISHVNVSDSVFDNITVDGFEYGIYINAALGARVAYCTWLHPRVNKCRVNWRILIDDTGYSAENKVIAGRLAAFASVTTEHHVHATRSLGAGSSTHWYWLSPSAEAGSSGGVSAFRLENMRDWIIESPRTEGTWSADDFTLDADCLNNRIELDYTADNTPTFTDLGQNTTIRYRGVTKPIGYLVASLPTASTWVGGEAFVVDATAVTIGSIVAGGGANKVKVMSNGTNWKIIAAV